MSNYINNHNPHCYYCGKKLNPKNNENASCISLKAGKEIYFHKSCKK